MRQSRYWRTVDGELEMGMLFAHHGAILGALFPFAASPHVSTSNKKKPTKREFSTTIAIGCNSEKTRSFSRSVSLAKRA